MNELPDDLESKLGYRIAYGEAAPLAEMARFEHGWGKVFAEGSAPRPMRFSKWRSGGAGPRFSPGQTEARAGDLSLHQAERTVDNVVAARHPTARDVEVVTSLDCLHTSKLMWIGECWPTESSR